MAVELRAAAAAAAAAAAGMSASSWQSARPMTGGSGPSTPLRQQGKRLFVDSPASAANLDSPAVSPPQGPESVSANPHLVQEQVVSEGCVWTAVAPVSANVISTTEDANKLASAPDVASYVELLQDAADTHCSDPTEIMAEEIMAEAQRSMQYLQQLRHERAEHRRWFVETTEQHAAGRKLAAQQLSRQRALRLLSRCFSALCMRIDRLIRQSALDGWGSRAQCQWVRAVFKRWARAATRWCRLARAFELTAKRTWWRTARVVLHTWRCSITCKRRGAAAARRADLRLLHCWFEQWAVQSMRWASIHQNMERSNRLALRQLECVSRKATRYERNRTAVCTKAWRTWSHRRATNRRLVARYERMYRRRRAKIAVVRAWAAYVAEQCRHTALSWHAVSVSRRLQSSLLHWQRATAQRRLHRNRRRALLQNAASRSRSRALTRTVFHLKSHATQQTRCRRLLARTLRGSTVMHWRSWHTVTVHHRRQRVILNRAGMKKRRHMLAICLIAWCQFERRQRRIRELRRRSICNHLRHMIRVWFANTSTHRLELALTRHVAQLADRRLEMVLRHEASHQRAALEWGLLTWQASHEHCRRAKERRLCMLRVTTAKRRRVALRDALGRWRCQTQCCLQTYSFQRETVLRAWIGWQSQLLRHHRSVAASAQKNYKDHRQAVVEMVLRHEASHQRAALEWGLLTWQASHEHCRRSKERRLCMLRVTTAKRRRVALRDALGRWRCQTQCCLQTYRYQLKCEAHKQALLASFTKLTAAYLAQCMGAWRQIVHSERAIRLQYLKVHMVAWSSLVCNKRSAQQRIVSFYKHTQRYQQTQRTFLMWSAAVVAVHRQARIALNIVRRADSRRVQSAYLTWSGALYGRKLQRIQDACTLQVSIVHGEARKFEDSLRAQMLTFATAKSARRRRYIMLSQVLGIWHRSTRASLRNKIPLLQTAFEIERVALMKAAALSADEDRQGQIFQLEQQCQTERVRSAQLLSDAHKRIEKMERQMNVCADELQCAKEKHLRQQQKWQEKWNGFKQYRVAVRCQEAELAQKKQALREWSQNHMDEIRQFIKDHQAEKQSCSQALQAAQQLECAAVERVAAKDHELSFAKRAAAVARREQAEARDQLVVTRAFFCATATRANARAGLKDAQPANSKAIVGPNGGESSPCSQTETEAGAVPIGDLVHSEKQIFEVLSRSTEELISAREEEEEAALALDYDIDSLLGEIKKELRLSEAA